MGEERISGGHKKNKLIQDDSIVNNVNSFHKIINDFAIKLIYLQSEEEIVWHIAREIGDQLGFVDCIVYIINEESNVLETKAASGIKKKDGFKIANPLTIPIGKGVVGSVAASGLPEIVRDTQKDPRFIKDINDSLSEIAVPIVYEEKVVGVIDSEHPRTNFFTHDHLLVLTTIAAMTATRIMNIRNQKKLAEHKENLEQEVIRKTKELEATVKSLNSSNQNLESFAYSISHDLREPLRTINGFVNMILKKEQDLSEETKVYFGFVTSGVKRMDDMMSGLMEYSRLNYSKDCLVDVNVADILLIIQSNLRGLILKNKAVLNIGEMPTIKGNKTQILQLFQNLIMNAIKFHKPDEAPIVDVSVEDSGTHYIFRIKDNGIGISEYGLTNVFRLFYREGNTGMEGSGIGLSLCKKIVEYHSGEIHIESKEGVGTMFIVSFPKDL